MAASAIWPTVTWPAKPLTMFSPTARMMLMQITFTTNWVYAFVKQKGSGSKSAPAPIEGKTGWIEPASAVREAPSRGSALSATSTGKGRPMVGGTLERASGRRRAAAPLGRSRTVDPWRLQAEVRVEGDACKHVHVVVLAALGILDQNSRAIAIAALWRGIGAEIDRTRRQTVV